MNCNASKVQPLHSQMVVDPQPEVLEVNNNKITAFAPKGCELLEVVYKKGDSVLGGLRRRENSRRAKFPAQHGRDSIPFPPD